MALLSSSYITSPLSIPTHPTQGHGEYIVYKETPHEGPEPLSIEQYQTIFRILNADTRDVPGSKFNFLQRELHGISPDLRVAFIPRVLYELTFFHECIEEEAVDGRACVQMQLHHSSYESTNMTSEEKEATLREKAAAGRCYHLCCFDDEAASEEDPHLTLLAHRINNLILTRLFSTTKDVSEAGAYSNLQNLLEREIAYFESIGQKPPVINSHYGNYSKIHSFSDQGDGRGRPSHPLGINNARLSDVIRNTFNLECSQTSVDSIVLYRGSSHSSDTIYEGREKTPKSLSYGLGILSGGLYDVTATPLYYIKKDADAFAIVVPKAEFKRAPFFLPYSTSTIYHLLSKGEFFHARTKTWTTETTVSPDGTFSPPSGVCGVCGEKEKQQDLLRRLYCVAPEDVESFSSSFEAYHSTAIHLDRGLLPIMLQSSPQVSLLEIPIAA